MATVTHQPSETSLPFSSCFEVSPTPTPHPSFLPWPCLWNSSLTQLQLSALLHLVKMTLLQPCPPVTPHWHRCIWTWLEKTLQPLKVTVISMSVPVVVSTPSYFLSPLKSPLSWTTTEYLFCPHKHRASPFLFQLNVTCPSSRNNIKQKEENEASTVGHAEALTTWSPC